MTEENNTNIFTDGTDATTIENVQTTEESTTIETIINQTIQNVTSSSMPEQDHYAVFEAFNIIEIIMTSVEMIVWIVAAIKMPRWRRNYRNQMLMQLSVARFVKRVTSTVQFLQNNSTFSISWVHMNDVLYSLRIYIDFVIVILVFFFIKHMYDSLIIVVVKMRQTSLYKVSICSWLAPIPISAVWTAVIVLRALDAKVVYLLICCIFRWPLIFMGTALYITILYRVLFDKIRRFARSLTIVTFLMCLMINFYLFSKDVIVLWCINSFGTKLISHISGLIMNSLILSFYILLITIDYKHGNQTPIKFNSIVNCSLADTCCKVSHLNENEDT